MALACGCIIFSLQGHEFLRCDGICSTQAVLYRWMLAMGHEKLCKIKCPFNEDCSVLDLVESESRTGV